MRHLLVSAFAISLLAGSLSPAYAAESRHERSAQHQRTDRNSYRSQDRSHNRNDGHHDRRADGRRNDRYTSDRRNVRDWNSRYSHDSRQYRDHSRRDDRRFDRHYRDYRPAYYDNSYRGRFHGGSYYRPYGYRTYSWHRGDRLPVTYYAPRYVIRDYGTYHLGYPPRGYHWVRVDNDVILAAITTGIVVQVVSDLFY